MIDLALAAALLLSAETPPAAQSYQAREPGKGHAAAQQTAGATAAPVTVPAAQAAAKPAGKPHPSAYGNREKGGHLQQPAAAQAPADGEQK